MTRDADIVVVGGGVTGLATARALRLAGRDVVLLEQFAFGNDRGSSHGTSRIFRLAYQDEHWVRLAQSALAAWRELEAERGLELIAQIGGLDIGPAAADTGAALLACGIPFELLTGADASTRWPIAFSPDEQVVFQRDGGILRADLAVSALAESAREAGIELHEHTRVTMLEPHRAGVEVIGASTAVTAAAVVVTAGSWAKSLLDPLGIGLPVVPTRETVSYFALPAAGEVPPVIDWARTPPEGRGIVRRPGQASYGLPAPGLGLKAGLHHSGTVADPDDTTGPEESSVRWAAEWVSRRYPEADPSPLATETCLYTNTVDESFVLERHGRVVVGSACSGHGFKFAPVVGRTLASLASEAAG